MKKALLLSLCLNVLLVLVACNAKPTASGKLHAFPGAMPGFRGLAATKTTAFNFSLVPEVHAQAATTVSLAGSFSGFCPSLTQPSGSAAVLWSGSQDPSACNTTNYPDALNAAVSAPGSALVIGAGTIGPLVVYADSSTWTAHVFVNRGGQILDAGIAATLDGKRGQSTATFPVLDGDTVAVVAVSDGTPSKNLSFVLEKQ